MHKVFDFEAAQPVTLLDFQNVGYRLIGRLPGGTGRQRSALLLSERFEGSSDDLLG